MKYTYKFSNENITIDLDEYWINVLSDFDRTNSSLERKNRRYITSTTDVVFDSSFQFENSNPENIFFENESRKKFWSQIDLLTKSQKDLIDNVCLGEMSKTEYAKMIGVSPSAVSGRFLRLQKKFTN